MLTVMGTAKLGSRKEVPEIHISLIGDGFVGKTALVESLLGKEFSQSSVPTIFQMHMLKRAFNGVEYKLNILDTGGACCRSSVTPALLQRTDCFLMCFAINKEDSFLNVTDKWIPEVIKLCPKAKIVLVGTKLDQRQRSAKAILHFQGMKLMQTIQACGYIECSAKLGIGVAEAFDKALHFGSTDGTNDNKDEPCCCVIS